MAVLSAEMTTSASPPAQPHEGDVWHNTLNDRRYTWTVGPSGRGAWVATPTVSPKVPEPIPSDAPDITNPVPKITMSNQPPLTPVSGDLWFDTVRGWLFVFYDDGNTTQWVVANPGRGGQEGPPGLPGAPAGPAGGDLFGFYPDPLIKADVNLGGAPTTNTPTTGDSSTKISTTAFVQDAVAHVPTIPVTLPPSGPAGGDLSGSYPNPSLKTSVALAGDPTRVTPPALHDNDTSIPTTAWVQTEISTAIGVIPAVTVPAGTIAFGGAGGVVTGNSTLAWDDTNKRLGIGTSTPTATVDARATVANQTVFSTTGYAISGGGTAPAFNLTGTVSQASPNIDVMKMSVANPNANGGNIIRLQAGPAGATDMFVANLAGDLNHAGISRNFYNTPPPTNGIYYYAYFLGNGAGGNIGLYAGRSNPTMDTFGGYGSIYMNLLSPGLPYYNNSGSTGWDRLVGETSTQTLSNKTITGYTPTSGLPTSLPPSGAAGGDLSGSYPNPTIKPSVTNGQVLTTVAGVAAWAAASGGGASTFVGTSPPASPTDGQLWFYTDGSVGGGNLYIRYNDGNSTAWVPAAPAAGSSSVPPGAIMDFAGAAAPAGWLLCQGQSVTTAAQPGLFAAIGYTYGGSGANFNVPDLGGRVTAGKEATATRLTTAGAGIDGSVLGAAGGTQTHTLTVAQLASHQHNSIPVIFPNSGLAGGSNWNLGYSNFTDYVGGDQPHQNTQPTIIMNKIIKTSIMAAIDFPASPAVNDIFIAGNGVSYKWNGTMWLPLSSGAGGASITVSDTPPGSPTAGALWWNSVLGTLMLYYTDPNTSQWVPAIAAGSNKLLQEISVETGAVATGTTILPGDDTIPQITEGDQYMSLSITPQSATSKLIIDILANLSTTAVNMNFVTALFQDSTANALAAALVVSPSSTAFNFQMKFTHAMVSGTTSPTTFRVRAGGNGANTTTFNGSSGTRQMGGVMASSIVIREVAT